MAITDFLGATRSRLRDPLQSYAFTLVDISLSPKAPFTVMGTPWAGFQSITAPEMTANMGTVTEMAMDWPRHYITNYTCSPITLSRGVSATNSTFYQWMNRSRQGIDRIQRRRDILLLCISGDSTLVGFELLG